MGVLEKFFTPRGLRNFHAAATIGWLLALPLSWLWQDAVPWVVFMSHWANTVGHWSSWQSARVEVNQDQDANVAEVLEAVKRLENRLAAIEGRMAGYRAYPYHPQEYGG